MPVCTERSCSICSTEESQSRPVTPYGGIVDREVGPPDTEDAAPPERTPPSVNRPDWSSHARTAVASAAIASIVVLGGVFWLSIGALLGAWDGARSALPEVVPGLDRAFSPPPPTPTALPVAAAPPAPVEATPVAESQIREEPVPVPAVAPTPQPTVPPAATPVPTPTASADQRSPWVLLPQPAPGDRVNAGTIVVAARGRGDAPISEIRLELNGAPLPVTMDQRSDTIWRAEARTTIGPGRHSVRAVVVDARGLTGSHRWTFDAGPP